MIIASVYPYPFETEIRHDSSSSIICDEKIYAYEEAKITKLKKDGNYPERSLFLGFKEMGIKPQDVDYWVFPKTKSSKSKAMLKYYFENYLKAINTSTNFDKFLKKKVFFIEHQISHISLSVYGSGFDKCIFLSTDGGGDIADQRGLVFGKYLNGKLKILNQSYGRNNLANYHSFVTDSLGFSGDDSGKTSGLSAYGKEIITLKEDLNSLLEIKKNNIFFNRKRFSSTDINISKINSDSFNREKLFNIYPSDTNVLRKSISYLPHDIAYNCETLMQEVFIKLLTKLTNNIKLEKIVFSGGLFENVSLNNKIIESKLFNDYYFPSSASDNGLSLGAALFVKNNINNLYSTRLNKKTQLSPYLGPSFTSNEIEKEINNFRLIYRKLNNPAEYAAKKIYDGKIVGFFQGRGEFGARSLGNRSILADPRDFSSKSKINQLLKKRDWFMPYAPAILENKLKEWVTLPKKSPYMQIAFKVKKNKRKEIPAAVHIDGSSRFQTVNKKSNPMFWNLINYFNKLTKIPMVLNTSFNRHGISTISSPRSAIEHLLEGNMDLLIIDKYLINFSDNRSARKTNIKVKDEKYLLKLKSIERLIVFKEYGSDVDFNNYLLQLSKLLSIKLTSLKHKKTSFNKKTYNIDKLIKELTKIL